MTTEELLSASGETVEYAKIYIEQQADYLRLETSKRLAKTTSGIVTVAVMAFLGFMVILFLSVSIGFFLGSLWESYGLAFLFLTGIYALVAILIYSFKDRIVTRPIISLVVENMLD